MSRFISQPKKAQKQGDLISQSISQRPGSVNGVTPRWHHRVDIGPNQEVRLTCGETDRSGPATRHRPTPSGTSHQPATAPYGATVTALAATTSPSATGSPNSLTSTGARTRTQPRYNSSGSIDSNLHEPDSDQPTYSDNGDHDASVEGRRETSRPVGPPTPRNYASGDGGMEPAGRTRQRPPIDARRRG